MMIFNDKIIDESCREFFGKLPDNIVQIKSGGSERCYYRLFIDNGSFIAVNGTNIKENLAYFHFTEVLNKVEIFVPKILYISKNKQFYIVNDLGNTDLLSLVTKERQNDISIPKSMDYYSKVVSLLPQIQFYGDKYANYGFCHQNSKFDKLAMQYDVEYFIEQFLNNQNLKYDKLKVIKEMNILLDFLDTEKKAFLMYRDFQARNIMIFDSNPYFIDFQGAREGPIYYDLVSLLNQAKAQLSSEQKNALKEIYYKEITKFITIDNEEFENYFQGFSIIRVLQTLGAYGLRGIKEKKQHFIESIPYALKNLIELIDLNINKLPLNYTSSILKQIQNLKSFH